MTRLTACSRQRFDVIIAGGGIVGAGIARDAALRGLSVALFEKNDFGGGATAGSTRLIHGGLRYLELLDLPLVRMDLREREILLRVAPHLVKPLEFLVPFYDRGLFYRAKLRAGMLLYDALSFDKSLPNHRFLSAAQTRAIEPGLSERGLQGAAAYYDAQAASPERLCLENVLDARAHGAVTLNYAEVAGGLRDGGVLTGVRVRDLLEGGETDVHGRVVVNASGPWFDRVAATLAPHPRPLVRTTKGIHVACSPVSRHAVVLFSKLDGRLFFVIPLLGSSFIGTTDTDFGGDPGAARATAADVRYLLESAAPFFPAVRGVKVHSTNAGVRALVMRRGRPSSISRLHRIVDGSREDLPGLVSVLGGKITGYRAIAEEATEVVCGNLGVKRPCSTAEEPLPGARGPALAREAAQQGGEALAKHLASIYGARASEVLEVAAADPALGERLAPDYPDIAAQVAHAARFELCVRVADFVLRRSLLAFTPDQGGKAAPAVARILARELAWSPARAAAELEHYRSLAESTRQP